MHYQTETSSQLPLKRKKTRHSLTLLCTALMLTGCQSFSGYSNSSMSNPISIRQQPAKNEKQSANVKRTPQETLTEVQVDPETVEAANAWEFILENPGIEYRMNQRIKAQKNWYLKHPAFLSQVLSRSEPFLGYVIEEADKRGLPRALALLPIVESRYDPQAISRAGAVGTWQFMPATAAHFGLKMNWWYDGRRDVVTSTDAALTYLDQLNQRFDGDWFLALASYNAGGGNVSKSIRRNEELGRQTDYWSLSYLPTETKNYVPRLLALLEIIKSPERYNVALPNIPVKSKVAIVDTLEQIDVASLARLAKMSEAEFRSLNPGLRRWASDPQGPYRVMIPSEKAPEFISALQSLPEEHKTSWTRHKVQPGDTISQIASAHNLPTSEFKRINQLSSSFIKVGQTLLVPQVQTLAADSGNPRLTRTSMQSGSSVALARSSQGQPVKLTPKRVNHKVAPGDTLWQISRKYNTSVKIIAAENSLSSGAPLKVGQLLSISLHEGESNQRVNYKVKPGDSLYGIAKQFNISIRELASWNALEQTHHIRPGQELTLYLSSES